MKRKRELILHGKLTGPGLKPGLNAADTGSVVNTVKGSVSFGRMASGGNNNMVSANASRKRK